MLSVAGDWLSVYCLLSVSSISRGSIVKSITNRLSGLVAGCFISVFPRPIGRPLETLAGAAVFDLVYANDRRAALFAGKQLLQGLVLCGDRLSTGQRGARAIFEMLVWA